MPRRSSASPAPDPQRPQHGSSAPALLPRNFLPMKTATHSFYLEAVQHAIERIVDGLDRAIPLESLARGACLSPFHFHRVFRGMTGETPLELARRLRLERAAWQLVQTTERVTAIAFHAGYEAHEAFTRAFRAAYGMSPSAFRRRGSMRFQLPARCGIHYSPDGRVAKLIPRMREGEPMEVEIRELDEQRVGTVRHTGPYNQIHLAFARLGEALGRSGVAWRPGMAMMALYYDDPESTPPEALRSDAAVVLPHDVQMPSGLVEQHIRGGRYACTVHRGPYEGLGDTWSRFLGEWLPASGYRIDGVSFEVYLNDPRNTRQDELLTEICVPLAD